MATRKNVADQYGITPAQAVRLRDAMSLTWCAIAHDWISCFESSVEALEVYGTEAAMIAEATLDADRIKMYGGDDPDNFEWVYKTPEGSYRSVLEMGEAVWNMTP